MESKSPAAISSPLGWRQGSSVVGGARDAEGGRGVAEDGASKGQLPGVRGGSVSTIDALVPGSTVAPASRPQAEKAMLTALGERPRKTN